MKNLFIFMLILGISIISACKKDNDSKPCGCEKDTLIEIKDYKTKYLYHYGPYNLDSSIGSGDYFCNKFIQLDRLPYQSDYFYKIINNQKSYDSLEFNRFSFTPLSKLINDGKAPIVDFSKNSILIILSRYQGGSGNLLGGDIGFICVPSLTSDIKINYLKKNLNLNLINRFSNTPNIYRELLINFFVFYIIPKIDNTYQLNLNTTEFQDVQGKRCDTCQTVIQ